MTWFRVFTQRLDWPYDIPVPEVLSAEECERYARFDRASLRTRYAQAHVFLRQTLSRFAAVGPADWQFGQGKFGRPFVAGPPAGLGLNFNLSHSRDYAACVVTDGAACGIDIERVRPTAHLLAIAWRRFAPEEFEELQVLEGQARTQRFFELWTEKEAWVKARGLGLTLGTNHRIGELAGVDLHRPAPPEDHAMAVVVVR